MYEEVQLDPTLCFSTKNSSITFANQDLVESLHIIAIVVLNTCLKMVLNILSLTRENSLDGTCQEFEKILIESVDSLYGVI